MSHPQEPSLAQHRVEQSNGYCAAIAFRRSEQHDRNSDSEKQKLGWHTGTAATFSLPGHYQHYSATYSPVPNYRLCKRLHAAIPLRIPQRGRGIGPHCFFRSGHSCAGVSDSCNGYPHFLGFILVTCGGFSFQLLLLFNCLNDRTSCNTTNPTKVLL
jgi:hypothetical protein